ncbi:type II toxin-antitoxin system VapC family toxin [Candidatus Microthrix sp.]|uniref:type II toxin-antitoxin system VapC family toxin n=1 Tax=Candidatus Neomicrothrix sp. TaxID=2719034 RepID=UPI00168FAA56|nr:type II toxin-antitoxin system VapC family toxin [Candidatus Microthrix sp.]MBP7877483.1 type II toxin-antitoxin system VapC family toxin [Candidatus Microthrix sp.]NLH66012.1 type II toxin-antitoxin system VapC family toxin [Candidatus Microthrix parvicella]
MIGTLVDSNVILDLLTEDEKWLDWSEQALSEAAEAGPLVINPVIYAEISVRFRSVEDLDEAIPSNDYLRAALPWSAAFLAGKAFVDYRRRGGTRTSTLPDFFIGAHAAAGDLTLLTRDVARYRTYFPTVRLIAP